MTSLTKSPSQRITSQRDEALIRECLSGNQNAWSELVDKYKALIYSVPVKKGLPPDGAADVFQEVCISLFSELPKLREPRALPAWLIRTAIHKSFHWERARRRYSGPEGLDEAAGSEDPLDPCGRMMTELRQEQLLRETLV